MGKPLVSFSRDDGFVKYGGTKTATFYEIADDTLYFWMMNHEEKANDLYSVVGRGVEEVEGFYSVLDIEVFNDSLVVSDQSGLSYIEDETIHSITDFMPTNIFLEGDLLFAGNSEAFPLFTVDQNWNVDWL